LQRERTEVSERVHGADAPLRLADVGPLGESADRGRHSGDDAERDEVVGSPLPLRAAEQVEDPAAEPGADGDVGERRVQRVAEPAADGGVLDECAAREADRVLHRRRKAVERLKPLEPSRDRVDQRCSPF